MEVFRLSGVKYANKTFLTSGKAARWNKDNQSVLYTGSTRSLSTLEMIVHKNSIKTSISYKVMIINIEDDESLYRRIYTKDLPKNWREYISYPDLQDIGSTWYENKDSLILQVPSAIIPQEFNYIINTQHPEFHKSVQYIRNEDYFWNDRLLG
jgi:RES domain-containing protein